MDGITQSIDILPTLLDLAGLPVPDQVQGRSLRSQANGDAGEDGSAFSAMWDNSFYSIASRGWKLIRNNGDSGKLALFDQIQDTGELHDVSTGQQSVVRELQPLLEAWARQEHLP